MQRSVLNLKLSTLKKTLYVTTVLAIGGISTLQASPVLAQANPAQAYELQFKERAQNFQTKEQAAIQAAKVAVPVQEAAIQKTVSNQTEALLQQAETGRSVIQASPVRDNVIQAASVENSLDIQADEINELTDRPVTQSTQQVAASVSAAKETGDAVRKQVQAASEVVVPQESLKMVKAERSLAPQAIDDPAAFEQAQSLSSQSAQQAPAVAQQLAQAELNQTELNQAAQALSVIEPAAGIEGTINDVQSSVQARANAAQNQIQNPVSLLGAPAEQAPVVLQQQQAVVQDAVTSGGTITQGGVRGIVANSPLARVTSDDEVSSNYYSDNPQARSSFRTTAARPARQASAVNFDANSPYAAYQRSLTSGVRGATSAVKNAAPSDAAAALSQIQPAAGGSAIAPRRDVTFATGGRVSESIVEDTQTGSRTVIRSNLDTGVQIQ